MSDTLTWNLETVKIIYFCLYGELMPPPPFPQKRLIIIVTFNSFMDSRTGHSKLLTIIAKSKIFEIALQILALRVSC